MSDAAAQQPWSSPGTFHHVLDEIAEDQREDGLDACSDDEAMEHALEAQRWARQELDHENKP